MRHNCRNSKGLFTKKINLFSPYLLRVDNASFNCCEDSTILERFEGPKLIVSINACGDRRYMDEKHKL